MIAELSILDKVSSKNINIKIKVGEEFSFQNLSIKVLKCYNSKFDDDPEVTAYIQVKDITMNSNDSDQPSTESLKWPLSDERPLASVGRVSSEGW